MDVAPLAAKQRVEPDLDFDQRIAGRLARAPLAPQAQDLPALQARRNGDVEAAAFRQVQALRRAADGVEKRDGQGVVPVLAAPPSGRSGAGRAARFEHLRKNVAQIVIRAEAGPVARACRPFRLVPVGALPR